MKSFFATLLLLSSLVASGQYISNGLCCDPSAADFYSPSICLGNGEPSESLIDGIVSDPDCSDFNAVYGCTIELACNYNPEANIDDDSCYFGGAGGDGPCSFELSTNQGYAPLTVQGTNLITDAGASYLWDFGNGQTSTALNPMFSYDTPGTYTVNVHTEVSELALTGVNITSLGGGWGQDIEDFFGLPDPYFVLSGPQGGIYTSYYVDGNETPTISGFNIPLDAGTTYNIAFYDSDGVQTDDDFLGASDFTPSGAEYLTVSNSTTAILYLVETQVASFNESVEVIVFEGLEVDLDNNGVSDDQEVYGCAYELADNYDVNVTRDDGSCIFPCEGQVNTNVFDWDGDYVVTVTDFLMMLSVYGDTDVDLDGVWDSGDDCVDSSACNYASDPSEPCAYIDVLGVCGGGCEADEDADGICDDIDTCIGIEDECGVCNGPGPTEVVIDDITILYDSVYAEQIDEWWVFEVGADTTFSITCAPFFGNCGDPLSYQGYDYETVQIGEQCWFAENLRTLQYSDDSPVTSGLTMSEWWLAGGETATYGGVDFCYAPEPSLCDTSVTIDFGRLYNWQAVIDPRGLCPSGWSVPSDEQWMTLEQYLGMSEMQVQDTMLRGDIQGHQLKSTFGWTESGNGSNELGFNARPGGTINLWIGSVGIAQSGVWWTSTEKIHTYSTDITRYAMVRGIYNYSSQVYRGDVDWGYGHSIRCIKDAE